jgi:hypothetical protein
VIAVLGLLAFVPIAIFALLPALDRPGTADLIAYGVLVPSNQFPLSATTSSAGVKLSWPLQSTNDTEASYLVFRSRQDLSCTPVAHAASQCSYGGAVVGVIPPGVSAFRDRPPAGRWSYRVALGAAAMGPADAAEPLLLSSAAAVTVGG